MLVKLGEAEEAITRIKSSHFISMPLSPLVRFWSILRQRESRDHQP